MDNNKESQLETSGEELVSIVRKLGSELKLSPMLLDGLELDTPLDSGLGLDSLTRVEFLARIEKHFDVSLPQSAFSNVATPRELLREIVNAGSDRHGLPDETIASLTLGTTGATPGQARTLLDVLDWHLQSHPDRPHIRFHNDSGTGETITYRQLDNQARSIAAALQSKGVVPGQAVAIMLPTCSGYFYTFFGILMAGAIPVPIYPPARLNQLEDHLIRHKNILNNCSAVALVTIREALSVARLLKSHVDTLSTIATPEQLDNTSENLLKPKATAGDIAFLQYTSGSTGIPKGVTLTHANLLANIRAMGHKLGVNSSDVFVSWLPLYHDMGLIGAWLGSFHYAALLVVMSPLDFLARPERWLKAIHQYRGTLTAAPNFAYELCMKRVPTDQLDGLKLDSVRTMFNGAEPVSPSTLQRFAEHFSRTGLKSTALMPVYGLAECSVGLSFPPVGRKPLVDKVSRDLFMKKGLAKPDFDSPNSLQFVSCGSPIRGHEVRIVDDHGRELPDRKQGRLQFRGPSTTSGYYRNPEKTRELFDGEWLNSGDLAYIAEGEIYLVGRSKDLIIHGGKNIYPQELEEKISALPDIRKGCVAVFGSQNLESGTEKLIVLAETRENDESRKSEIEILINGVVSSLAGNAPDEVILAPPHTVLKTSSGKIRRSGCKELYEKQSLQRRRAPWMQFASLAVGAIIPELRRLGQAAFSFCYAGYAWTVFGLLTTLTWPAVILCPTLQGRLSLLRNAVRVLSKLTKIPIIVRGEQNLPSSDQACVLVSNHCSYMDTPALMFGLPLQFSFVAKAELRSQFFARLFLDRIQAEFVTRFQAEKGIADAEKITRAADSGKNLLFFAEGTFTRIPGLRPFYMGAFTTAVDTGNPVVPVVINGTRSVLRPDSWFPRHGSIHIDILEPIDPGEIKKTNDRWQHTVRLSEKTRRAMLVHLREPDLSE